METKSIKLIYQMIKYNDKGQSIEYEPKGMCFSYSEYFGKVPVEILSERLDETYKELKKHLIEELENDI